MPEFFSLSFLIFGVWCTFFIGVFVTLRDWTMVKIAIFGAVCAFSMSYLNYVEIGQQEQVQPTQCKEE